MDIVRRGGFRNLADYLGIGIALNDLVADDMRLYIRDPELPPTWWHFHLSTSSPPTRAIEYDFRPIGGSKYEIHEISRPRLREWLSEHYGVIPLTPQRERQVKFILPSSSYEGIPANQAESAAEAIVNAAFDDFDVADWLPWVVGVPILATGLWYALRD